MREKGSGMREDENPMSTYDPAPGSRGKEGIPAIHDEPSEERIGCVTTFIADC